MEILCTIAARGGSKGLPNKNIKLLKGKPLIAHTIEQAINSKMFSQIAVTSDSKDILNVARDYPEVTIVERPDELASDTSSKLPALRHAVTSLEEAHNKRYDVVVDLDVTSPLREINDIKECIKIFLDKGVSNLITAMPARRSPYFNLIEKNENGEWKPAKYLGNYVHRRQNSPECFDMNASIYVYKRDILMEHDTIWFEDTELYVMPENRSIDIDNEIDFKLVELLMSEK